MAVLHNFSGNKYNESMISGIGQKIKNAAEFASMAKGVYDVGRMIYAGARTIGPMIGPAIAML